MDPLLYLPPENQQQLDAITLNDALAVCIDSLELLEHAEKHCEGEKLRGVFASLIDTKRRLVTELQHHLRSHETTPTINGTLTGDMRRWYLTAREWFSNDIDQLLLERLYDYEVRNLKMLQQAIVISERVETIEELKFAKRLIEMHIDTLQSLKMKD
ncbi:DUF2383 domain-containing protein [Alteromonas oceanisediminis]|uniref:DUF2383 domain-containing protein n=1 Tax=Alteromonas oceanisediminis TaxID=2836180 RepID=UPI001BDB6C00|nr:DUF2383 domain-containing protein [Alteromonas oceanisediminis]MBT0586697.1 DUF2383 domain-containing protein [Alteromonas oceanisediminis]